MESGITIRQKEKTLQECKIKQGKCHMLRWQDISSFFYNRYRKEEILKRKEEKLMSLLEVKIVWRTVLYWNLSGKYVYYGNGTDHLL